MRIGKLFLSPYREYLRLPAQRPLDQAASSAAPHLGLDHRHDRGPAWSSSPRAGRRCLRPICRHVMPYSRGLADQDLVVPEPVASHHFEPGIEAKEGPQFGLMSTTPRRLLQWQCDPGSNQLSAGEPLTRNSRLSRSAASALLHERGSSLARVSAGECRTLQARGSSPTVPSASSVRSPPTGGFPSPPAAAPASAPFPALDCLLLSLSLGEGTGDVEPPAASSDVRRRAPDRDRADLRGRHHAPAPAANPEKHVSHLEKNSLDFLGRRSVPCDHPKAEKGRTMSESVLAQIAALKHKTLARAAGALERAVRSRPASARQTLSRGSACTISCRSCATAASSEQARRKLDALADQLEPKAARRRSPGRPIAGTELRREWKGIEHVVKVRENDFEYDGRPYKSLSAIARAITNTRWNGWLFFGLNSGHQSR